MVSMIDTVIGTAIHKSQVYLTKLSSWKSQQQLNLECGPYRLRIAQTQAEVISCFKLRHEIFFEEMAGKSTKTRLDYDEYDSLCDHLIIFHEPTQKIVGTYRMNSSQTSKSFYTQSEFEITSWMRSQTDDFIELGRACIQKDHRRGAVISFLWKGILDYMKLAQADCLLGCSSVKVSDARSAALIFKYFEIYGNLSSEIFSPTPKYQMPDFLFWMMVFAKGLNEQQLLEAEEKIPSLLNSYIKAGAKVCSYPALDQEFKCIDFVTMLKRSELDQKLVRKYSA